MAKTLSELLKYYREKKGFSVTKLSNESGVPRSTIHTIETTSTARSSTLSKLAIALDLTPQETDELMLTLVPTHQNFTEEKRRTFWFFYLIIRVVIPCPTSTNNDN